MAWATADDVIDAWIGEGAPEDDVKVELWIGKAEREVLRRIPDIQTRIDAEAAEIPPRTDLLDAAVDVVVAMVTRVFRNPTGIRQANVTTGPFSEQQTYGGDNPGALELLPSEFDMLAGGIRGGRAFEFDTMPSSSPYSPYGYFYDDELGWTPSQWAGP